MEFPEELFKEIYWSFSEPLFDTQNEFRDALKTYHKTIGYKTGLPPIKWEEVVIESPVVGIQCAIFPSTEDEEIMEPQKELTADNGKNFTAKELLFKVHNLVGVPYLADEDNRFFEGLTFATEEDPSFPDGTPVYFLDTGS